ncbi:MAG: GGDEF domain-containing protein [Sideroxydans sp.]|nr:GGDEF domain-containing protein [Sideroxydans sp.]
MRLVEFLSGGIHFTADDAEQAFRTRLLNAAMLASVVSSLLFIALELAGINSLGEKQLSATIVHALVCVGVIRFTWHQPSRFMAGAIVGLLSAYLVFTTAVIWVVADEFRMIWYFILVACSYMLLGIRFGLAVTALSIITIAVIKFGGHSTISDNAFFTFTLSLLVASAITYALVMLNRNYHAQLDAKSRQLQNLANLDPLTGVWNSRAYYALSDKLFRLAKRNKATCATLFIDLDHFKSINDSFGHETGDRVLMSVSECLARNIRNSDLLGRVGGEEFVVFLPDTDSAGAIGLAEKLRASVRRLPVVPGESAEPVSVSIGVAQCSPDDLDTSAMQHRADQAMYVAKRNGRNRVMVAPAASPA